MKHRTPRPEAAEPVVPQRAEEIEQLITGWLTVPEAAERQGLAMSAVRQQIKDGHLLAVRRGESSAVYIPELFVTEEGPLPGLVGTVTVLTDGGMDVEASLVWLYTVDPTLHGGSSPIAELVAGRKSEVRRRAMESAF